MKVFDTCEGNSDCDGDTRADAQGNETIVEEVDSFRLLEEPIDERDECRIDRQELEEEVVRSFGAKDQGVEEVEETAEDESDDRSRVGDGYDGTDPATGLFRFRRRAVLELPDTRGESVKRVCEKRTPRGLTNVPE